MKLTNIDKSAKLKETRFSCLEEEDVSIYFMKLDKEQECLKKMEIKWYDTQKVTQAVDEMYNSSLFDKKQMMEWEDKDDVNKTWGVCKMLFKKYYELKKRYINAKTDRMGFKSAVNVADKSEIESDELKNYLGGLRYATRA